MAHTCPFSPTWASLTFPLVSTCIVALLYKLDFDYLSNHPQGVGTWVPQHSTGTGVPVARDFDSLSNHPQGKPQGKPQRPLSELWGAQGLSTVAARAAARAPDAWLRWLSTRWSDLLVPLTLTLVPLIDVLWMSSIPVWFHKRPARPESVADADGDNNVDGDVDGGKGGDGGASGDGGDGGASAGREGKRGGEGAVGCPAGVMLTTVGDPCLYERQGDALPHRRPTMVDEEAHQRRRPVLGVREIAASTASCSSSPAPSLSTSPPHYDDAADPDAQGPAATPKATAHAARAAPRTRANATDAIDAQQATATATATATAAAAAAAAATATATATATAAVAAVFSSAAAAHTSSGLRGSGVGGSGVGGSGVGGVRLGGWTSCEHLPQLQLPAAIDCHR